MKILEGYVVKFYYQGRPVKALFLEKQTAEQHAIKWHGTISEVFSEEAPIHGDGEAKLCQESLALPHSSTTDETGC